MLKRKDGGKPKAREYGENVGAEVMHVRHRDLKRAENEGYKSICPICPDGVLLMRRNQKTGQLLAEDLCVACGQRFVYTDISELEGD